jgi:phage terminase Nu1 subunit (DNA packaging protein)
MGSRLAESHRGDLANARYWYRRAQRDVAEGDLREEAKTIAVFLLKR